MLRRFFLLVVMILFVMLPWYKKHLYSWMHRYFSNKCSLIDLDCIRDVSKINICNDEDLKELIKIISMYDPKLTHLNGYSDEEKFAICKEVIENYIIDPYIVEKYLEDNNLVINAEFIKNKEMFMKIMQNNFYINFFKRHIAKKIIIDDNLAKPYYENNKCKEFNKKPFAKTIASIDARIIKMKKEDQSYSEYEALLLSNETSIPMMKYNPYLGDSILSTTLRKMKKKSYDIITLEDNNNYMIYKIDEIEGEWEDFEKVKDDIKKYMHNLFMNEKISAIIGEIKTKCQIKVCEETLKKYLSENKFKEISVE